MGDSEATLTDIINALKNGPIEDGKIELWYHQFDENPQDFEDLLQALRETKQTTLKDIRLNWCFLDGAKIRALVEVLKERPDISITDMDLSNNKIGPEGAEALAGLPALESLELHSAKIGDAGAAALAKAPKLSFLNVVANHIGPEGVKSLASAKLTELELSANPIKKEGVEALAKNNTIERLFIEECELIDEDISPIWSNTTLVFLDAGTNGLNGSGMKGLSSNTTLRELHLDQCVIDAEGANTLADNNLDKLFLGSNSNIKGSGVRAIAAGKNQLKELNFSQCHIGVYDPQSLADLKRMKSLQVLSLHNNNLGDESADMIADLIKTLDLKKIDLGTNDFTDIGAQIILSNKGNTEVPMHLCNNISTYFPSGGDPANSKKRSCGEVIDDEVKSASTSSAKKAKLTPPDFPQ